MSANINFTEGEIKAMAEELSKDYKAKVTVEIQNTEFYHASREQVMAAAAQMVKRGYEPKESALDALTSYLEGYNLWLAGEVGTGKTAFFKAAPLFLPPEIKDSPHYPRRVIVDMASDFDGMTISDIREYLFENRYNEIVLDDVGNEGTLNDYGNRREILPFVMAERAKVAPCTHLTTNYEKTYFDERYGYGFFDRLRSSAYFVKFSGISRRQLAPHINRNVRRDAKEDWV